MSLARPDSHGSVHRLQGWPRIGTNVPLRSFSAASEAVSSRHWLCLCSSPSGLCIPSAHKCLILQAVLSVSQSLPEQGRCNFLNTKVLAISRQGFPPTANSGFESQHFVFCVMSIPGFLKAPGVLFLHPECLLDPESFLICSSWGCSPCLLSQELQQCQTLSKM